MRLRVRAGLAVASIVILLIAACGADEKEPTAGGAGEDRYAKCMAENGGDPGVDLGGGQGKGTASAPAGDQRDQQAALEKCRKYLPDGGTPRPLSPEELEKARTFAKCMRAEGLPFPDPDPKAGGFQGGPGADAAPVPDGVDMDDPKVQAAFEKCTKKVGGGTGVETGSAGDGEPGK